MDTLSEHFLDDSRKVISCLTLRHFVKVHKNSNERCLTICSHKSDDLILYHLNALNYFSLNSHFGYLINSILVGRDIKLCELFFYLTAVLITGYLYERSKVRKSDTLSAIL